MKPVIIHREAELELIQAVAYYEQQAIDLGLDLETEVRRALADIQETPTRWPKRKQDTRRRLLRRFPYAVHYIDLAEAIWVVAFAHTSRKPYYWLDRTDDYEPGPASTHDVSSDPLP